MRVAPGSSFEATVTMAAGLAGTIGVRIRDNAGADFLARTTAGITADVTVGSTSVYRRNFTAPTDAGQYTIVWDDGTNILTEELVVTSSAAIGGTATLYASRDELKNSLSASGTSYLDDDLDDALNAASRAIDEATGRRFYPVTETRVYTADCGNWISRRTLDIDDLNTLTTLSVDNDGDGTYETTWTEDTDFFLDPPNAPLDNMPYERVLLARHAGRTFPQWDNAVQIAGSFGFATTPPEVKQYTKVLATQLLIRSRQAPFGIVMAGSEIGAALRIGRYDPDFDRLLGHLVKPHRILA